MLSKSRLGEIIEHTSSVTYIRQYLLARVQKNRGVSARIHRQASEVIEELGQEADRESIGTGDASWDRFKKRP